MPTPFLPGVVLGAATFLGLYAWPFVEAKLNPDKSAHQLLDRPREHPVRLGLGVAAFSFYTLLLMAAADDIAARFLRVPVTGVVTLFRILVLTVPWVAGLVAYILARALRPSGAPGLGSLTWAHLRAALRRRPPARPPAEHEPPRPEVPAVRSPRRIETFASPDETWRWRYVDEPDGVRLTGNVAVESEDEAGQAGRTAYPDVPVTRAYLVELDRTIRTNPEALRPRLPHRVIGALLVPVLYLMRRRQRK